MVELAQGGEWPRWRAAVRAKNRRWGDWIGRTGFFSTLAAGVPGAACYATAARSLLTSESQRRAI